MGLTDEYRKEVEDVESSLKSRFSRHRAHRLKVALDNIMPFTLLLIAFVLVFEFVVPITSRMEIWITRANWALISYFTLRLAVAFRLSRSHHEFMHQHWLDILLVVPVFSMFREIRAGRYALEMAEAPMVGRFMAGQTQLMSTTQNAAKLTRMARILRRSV
ncbi:MAG: hypothetical protein ABEI58_02950 [Candidatus Nanohaloarchaea archaeon]